MSEYELLLLFQSIGNCTWHLQTLENAISTYIVVSNYASRNKSSDYNKTLFGEYERLSLGELFVKYKNDSGKDKAIAERIEKIKIERNWLIHNSMHDYNSSKNIPIKSYIDRINKLAIDTLKLSNEIQTQTEINLEKEHDMSKDEFDNFLSIVLSQWRYKI